MSKPLEQRVAAALTTDTKSDTVTALIAEVEAAAQAADADATKLASRRSTPPSRSTPPRSAPPLPPRS